MAKSPNLAFCARLLLRPVCLWISRGIRLVGLEIEIVPQTVTEDKGVGAGRFLRREQCAKAFKFVGRDGEANHLFDWRRISHLEWIQTSNLLGRATDNIDRVGWTCQTFGIVLDHIARFEYALNGASFDVELVVAKAILSAAPSVEKTGDWCFHLPLFW